VEEREFDLIFVMHHIISDGVSMDILRTEFAQFYRQVQAGIPVNLPALAVQYKEFAAWQNQLFADPAKMSAVKAYWAELLSREIPVIQLPTDRSYQSLSSRDSGGYRFVIPAEVKERLKTIAIENKASLFSVLLAGFNWFLYNLTGQEDLLMGMPVAGREHETLRNLIGYFINTVILCNQVNPNESFSQFLHRVQEGTLQSLEYQSYPMEMILTELEMEFPKLSVFFNMLSMQDNTQPLPNLESFHLDDVQDVKFDLVCYLKEYANGIEVICNYLTGLFNPATIEYLMGEYLAILQAIADNPDLYIDDLDD
jgi:hypothetical protein